MQSITPLRDYYARLGIPNVERGKSGKYLLGTYSTSILRPVAVTKLDALAVKSQVTLKNLSPSVTKPGMSILFAVTTTITLYVLRP